MQEFYRYDADGIYVCPEHALDCPEDCTPVRPPDGLFRGKWTGSEWVETGTPPDPPPPPEPDENTRLINTLLGVS